MASGGLSPLLALEIAGAGRAVGDRRGAARSVPSNVRFGVRCVRSTLFAPANVRFGLRSGLSFTSAIAAKQAIDAPDLHPHFTRYAIDFDIGTTWTRSD
jgi:hypothetical protein